MSRHVLVTGGAGYIGSHTCKALARAGYTPVTVDSLIRGHRELVKWGPLKVFDIANMTLIRKAMAEYKVEAVLHFAALAAVAESVRDPSLYYYNNVKGTLVLLDAMRAEGVGRLIFSSSCAVHGVPPSVPIIEAMPCNPINPYGRSKWMMEQAMQDYSNAYGLRYVALRYFNAAGADAEGETGEKHDPETHAIPLAIAAARGGAPFNIFGTDYPTPDGTAIRDYIHVSDLADAHVKALHYLEHGGSSIAMNVGTGEGTSVRELLRVIAEVSGGPVPAQEAPRRAGDPPALVADPATARTLLGFVAQRSDIRTIVESAWRWHEK